MRFPLILSCFVLFLCSALAAGIDLSERQASVIGRRIWQNESAGTIDGLTAWNDGENFASLGIGHFIWYPKGIEGPFDESFPKLVDFLRAHRVEMPGFLSSTGDCPWSTKAAFEKDFRSPRMKALRDFLARTVPEQTQFIVARLETALSKMLDAVPAAQRPTIRSRFYSVASTPEGVYALIDYVNFKGEGLLSTERYEGEGWGLLQVLQHMEGFPEGRAAVQEFARSAKKVLTRRVESSPAERGESRWLAGWKNRIDTYAK